VTFKFDGLSMAEIYVKKRKRERDEQELYNICCSNLDGAPVLRLARGVWAFYIHAKAQFS